MSEEESETTYDRVVKLLNNVAFLPSEKERVAVLSQLQELVVHGDPSLIQEFCDIIIAFQTDINADVRKFVVGFIEETCKKNIVMLPKLMLSIQRLLKDEAMVVVKRVIQCSVQLHRSCLTWMSSAHSVTNDMEDTWKIISDIKTDIIAMIDHDNDGVRTQAIKFLESLILVQTYSEPDSIHRDGEFNLDKVPLTLKVARPRILEEEARQVVDKLIAFEGSLHISSVNLMTCISSLTIVARARPQFMGKVIQALELLHANLPPTLTKSQVNSVRKHLKIQLINILRHVVSYEYQTTITPILSDLGCSNTEVNRAMPSKSEIRKRIKRNKPKDDDVSEAPGEKKARIESPEKDVEEDIEEDTILSDKDLPSPPVEESSTAVNITKQWLVEHLNIEKVANLVMVTMLNLPEVLPPLFSASYSPVTSAGSPSQIEHVARLLAAQLTNAGLGPGLEEASTRQLVSATTISKPPILSLPLPVIIPSVTLEEPEIERPCSLIPATLPVVVVAPTPAPVPVPIPVPTWKRGGTVQLSAVTSPLSYTNNQALQQTLLKRIISCDKTMLYGGAHKHRLRILISLSSFASDRENKELESFIMQDLQGCTDLLLSWLYCQHSVQHDFSLSAKLLRTSGGTIDVKPPVQSYCDILAGVVHKILSLPPNKDREELLLRILTECPSVPSEIIEILSIVGEQGEEAMSATSKLLTDLAVWRPMIAKPALQLLTSFATHEATNIREKVLPSILEVIDTDEVGCVIVTIAREHINYLLEQVPPAHFMASHLGRPHTDLEWTEFSVKACLYLCLAILPTHQSLIHDLAQVYVKTVNEAKRGILRLLETPISKMGMESPEVLTLVESCPKGSETLITRIIHILTEKVPPSEELVCRVRDLYNQRVSDVRFLIPVLTGLSKKEVIAVLPKLIKLNPHVVKEVLNRLWGVTLDTGTSPITPVDLLVALHTFDTDKCEVKTVIKATGLCFGERSIYTAEVLAMVLQQLMELPALPTLFMRTVIQTLTHYPKLLSFIINILHRLIAKQVWKYKKVWEGFIKCCQRAFPTSFTVLLQLPPPQLTEVLTEAPTLHKQIIEHVTSLTDDQRVHIPANLLEVILGTTDISTDSVGVTGSTGPAALSPTLPAPFTVIVTQQ